MSCNPDTVFLLPCPLLCGADNVESVSAEEGICTPVVIVPDGNCGDLVPSITGVPEDPALSTVQMRIQESGDITEAGFVFRFPPDTLYRGADDGRRWHRTWAPFHAPTHPDIEGGNSAVYCEAEKRLIISAVDEGVTPSEIVLQTRDVEDPYDTWSEASFDPAVEAPGAPELTNGVFGAHQQRIAMAYISATLLLAYLHRVGTDNHVALIKSTDGGSTWQFVGDNIMPGIDVSEVSKMRMTPSGDWLRLDVWSAAGDFFSAASDTRGLSWTTPVETQVNTPTLYPANDLMPYGVAGIGDGIYVLAMAAGSTFWWIATAFGDQAYKQIDVGGDKFQRDTPSGAKITGMAATTAHDRVYVLVAYTDQTGVVNVDDDQVALYYQEISRVLGPEGPGALDLLDPDPEDWQVVQPMSNHRGARFLPTRIDLLAPGNQYLFAYYGAYDIEDEAEVLARDVGQVSGFSVQSYGNIPPGGNLTSTNPGPAGAGLILYDVMWQSVAGRPAGGVTGAGGGTSPDSEWTQTSAGAPSVTWTPRHLNIITGVASSNYFEWLTAAAAGSGVSWALQGATAGTIVRINSGSSQAATQHGMRLFSPVSGTNDVDFVLRMDTTGVTVRDLQAASDVASIAIDLTGFCEIRVKVYRTGGVNTGTLVGFRMDDYFADPVAVDDFTLADAATTTGNDVIRFASLGTGTGNSDWREVWVSRSVTRDAETGVNPDLLLGIPARFDRVLVGNCLYVSWGGTAAAVGDSFGSQECHLHPAEAVFQDGCAVDWRTPVVDPLPGATLIFVADPDNDTERLVHDGVVLCGIEDQTVLVDYDDDPAFPSPTPVETVDATTYPGLIVTASNGNAVTFLIPSNLAPPLNGELAGQRLRVTSGSSTGATYKILTHCIETATGAHTLTIDLPDGGVAPTATTTFDVFAITAFHRYAARRIGRYVRYRFGDTETATGDHRLGAHVLGCAVDVPFELEWTFTDAETPDVTIFDGANVSWGYELGRPRRTWVGRIVNDYQGWREGLRYLVETLAQYGVRPMAVVLDSGNARYIIRGRWQAAPLENSFWFPSEVLAQQIRTPGGDQRLSIVEVP